MRIGDFIDLVKNELRNARIQNLGTAPSSPATGQIYLDTTASPPRLYVWNGSAWALLATDSDKLSGQAAAYYLARGNHTGTQLAATISDFNTAVRTNRLDQMATPTADVAMGGMKITGAADGVADTDVATYGQIKAAIQGLAPKDSARVWVGSNVNLASPGANLDGIAMAAGDRFIAAAQTTGSQNGLYVWNGAAVPATRATDADTALELEGALIPVEEGTKANRLFMQTTVNFVLGTGTPSFSDITGSTYVGGAGMTLTGVTFDIVAADGSIVVNADSITVGLVPVSKGGTNATTAAAARTNLGAVGFYATTIGDGSTTSIAVTHNLNTRDITVQAYDTSTFERIWTTEVRTSVNVVTLTFGTAPTTNSVRVVVQANS